MEPRSKTIYESPLTLEVLTEDPLTADQELDLHDFVCQNINLYLGQIEKNVQKYLRNKKIRYKAVMADADTGFGK